MFLHSNGDLNGSTASGGSSELTFADIAHNNLKKNGRGAVPRVRLNGGGGGSPFAGGDFITNRHSGEFILEQVCPVLVRDIFS